jgi:hypothetical protein
VEINDKEGAFMRRVFLVAAALAIPASAATVDLSGGIASAIGVTTTCTTMTGTVTGEIFLEGCTGGSTGGGSQFVLTSTVLATGGTITWNNGNTTTITAGTLKTSQKLTTKCVAKYGPGTSGKKKTAVVTTQVGTGDSPIPGVFKAKMCIDSAGNIHALKPTTVT